MADTHVIPGTEVEVKPANPVAVGFLALLIIPPLFTWYRMNRELKELGEARGWDLGSSPGLSVAALLPGAFVIVPPYVTSYTTCERIKHAQIYTGRKDWMEGWIGLLMTILLYPLTVAFAQDQLNKVWQNLGVPTPYEKEAMLPPAPPPVGGYGAQPPYGQPYGQPPGYGAPAPGYGPPPPGYGQPPPGGPESPPSPQPPPPGHRPPDAPPPA